MVMNVSFDIINIFAKPYSLQFQMLLNKFLKGGFAVQHIDRSVEIF